jgi:glycosyltransferase involved in cell wall biosynthesis
MPVYNVDPKWLDLAIKSIENQWYENWELCIADDKSSNKDTIEYLNNLMIQR